MDADQWSFRQALLAQQRVNAGPLRRLNKILQLPSLRLDAEGVKIVQANIDDVLPPILGGDRIGEQEPETAFAPAHPVGGAAHVGQRGDVGIIGVQNDRQIESLAP